MDIIINIVNRSRDTLVRPDFVLGHPRSTIRSVQIGAKTNLIKIW